MSRSKFVEIDCPECGLKQEVSIWESINVTVDPDLKEKIFQGRINVLQCQKCGIESFIPVPLMYHDMRKKFCVQFYPFNWLELDDFLQNFTKEGGLNIGFFKLPKYSKYFKWTHIVFDMNEFVRYVIFRDKLQEKWEMAS